MNTGIKEHSLCTREKQQQVWDDFYEVFQKQKPSAHIQFQPGFEKFIINSPYFINDGITTKINTEIYVHDFETKSLVAIVYLPKALTRRNALTDSDLYSEIFRIRLASDALPSNSILQGNLGKYAVQIGGIELKFKMTSFH